jgi:hypothetical protein
MARIGDGTEYGESVLFLDGDSDFEIASQGMIETGLSGDSGRFEPSSHYLNEIALVKLVRNGMHQPSIFHSVIV